MSFAWNAVKPNDSLIVFAGEYPLEIAHRFAVASDGKVSQQAFHAHSKPVESQLINWCLQLSPRMCDALNVIFREVSAHTCNWDWQMPWVVIVTIQQVRSLHTANYVKPKSACKFLKQSAIIREVSSQLIGLLECSRQKFRPDALKVFPPLHLLTRWIYEINPGFWSLAGFR